MRHAVGYREGCTVPKGAFKHSNKKTCQTKGSKKVFMGGRGDMVYNIYICQREKLYLCIQLYIETWSSEKFGNIKNFPLIQITVLIIYLYIHIYIYIYIYTVSGSINSIILYHCAYWHAGKWIKSFLKRHFRSVRLCAVILPTAVQPFLILLVSLWVWAQKSKFMVTPAKGRAYPLLPVPTRQSFSGHSKATMLA